MSKDKSGRSRTTSYLKTLFQILKPHIFWLIFYVLLSTALSVLVVISVPIRSYFIDTVLEQQNTAQTILALLLLNLFIIFLIRYGFPALQNHLDKLIIYWVSLDVKYAIAKKKAAIRWSYYEDPEINDKFELIKDAPDCIWLYFKSIIGVCSTAISTIGIFIIMKRLGVYFVAFLFLLFIPIVYYSIQAGRGYYNTWERTAKLRRYCNYQRDVMMDKEYATERTLFGYVPFFLKRWEKDYQQTRTLSIQEELRGSKKVQIAGAIFCLYIGAMVFVIINRLAEGQITAGDAVSLLSILPLLINNMIVTTSNQINQIVRAKRVVEAWMDFEILEDEEDAFDLPKRDGDFYEIVFNKVSFRYPQTSQWVLKNVDMRLEKGKHYAIVGENGAGKSTLIKLLLRLYLVSEGEILIDGKNINDIPRAQLLSLVTVLFQDHQHYYTNVAENIGIGNINYVHDRSRIIASAKEANFHKRIENMPAGYETILGAMNEGGVELSGGEWQKLAITRLLMSPNPIKILDEPTASMDPVFEYSLYQDFNSIMKNKTTITISHRLASCKYADHIYVLDHGSICEQGSHEKLMDDKKLYYKMYTTQKEMYV